MDCFHPQSDEFTVQFLKSIPPHEKRITLATGFTLLRIMLVPFIVGAMIIGHWSLAFWLFIAAAVTDVLDGAIARWRNEQTYLGACLDPIADKLLMVSCFFTLAFVDTPFIAVPYWFVVILLIKELIIVGGAYAIYCMRRSVTIAPTWLGKMTTVVQVIFIVWLFACYFFNGMSIKIYYAMFAMVVGVTGLSFVHYVSIGVRQLMHTKDR